MRVSACTLYFQKLESLAYIFVAACMGLSSFKFVKWAPKDACFLHRFAFWPFKVVQGHPRSMDFGTNRKRVCDFLLVGHCDYGPILHRFWDTATYWLKIAYFSYPFLIWCPRSLCSLWNFAVKSSVLETRVMGLSSSEDPVIVAYVVLTQCQRVTDRQTDGRIYYG